MKLGFFTDPHYGSDRPHVKTRFYSQSLRKMKEAYAHFEAANCDLVICLGDLIDQEKDHADEIAHLREAAAVIDASSIPTVCVMGNHDAFTFTPEEFYQILGQSRRPRNQYTDGKNLIFLDACFYSDGTHYLTGDDRWEDTFYPDADGLEQLLTQLQGDTYLFLHQNIDPNLPENHRLSNDAQLRKLLEQSGIVRTVFQGHYHPGSHCTHNGIQYVTFAAMSDFEDTFRIVEI